MACCISAAANMQCYPNCCNVMWGQPRQVSCGCQVLHAAGCWLVLPAALLLLQAGRVRPTLDCSSVSVRLVCGSRQGQLEAPAWSVPLAQQRLTR